MHPALDRVSVCYTRTGKQTVTKFGDFWGEADTKVILICLKEKKRERNLLSVSVIIFICYWICEEKNQQQKNL